MNGMVNKLLAKENLEAYEDAGEGMAQKISQDNEGLVDRENVWEPL